MRIGYELNMGNWNLIPEVGFTYNRIIDSEIEGDAVLFYRLGEMPTLAELSEQIKTMFGHRCI